MFLVNSRLGLFTSALFRGRPFSRSYRAILPSSLTTFLPLALGFSPHLPVSVCGTGTLSSPFLATEHRRLPYCSSVPFARVNQRPGSAISMCQLLAIRWLRNFNRMCIDYAFRPRLSSRLTLGGRTVPKKPEIFGHYDSHIILATHSGILTRVQSTRPLDRTSPRTRRSPTTAHCAIPSFGYMLSPVKFSAQDHSTSELLRTL